MQNIVDVITEKKKILKIDNTFYEIVTDAEIKKGVNVRIFLKQVGDKILLTDNKHTLRYMNNVYELAAPDVKQCINDIVKYYKFKIDKGEIFTELDPSTNVLKRYNDLLICCATLANMYIFFDEPKA